MIFKTSVIVSLAPLSPCLTKLLCTKLVEKLVSWDKPCATYLKNIWHLGISIPDIIMPLNEFKMLDAFDCLDANSIKQRDRIPRPDIKKSSDYRANICTNLDDAFHVGYFTQTFNGCLQRFVMRLNKIEFALIFCNLFGLAINIDFTKITLLNKAQNNN
jgi:hypothetical protein